MPTRNVDLTDHCESFIDAGVASGRFSDASAVVRAGLFLLERAETDETMALDGLRSAAQEGIDALERGEYTSLHSRAEVRDFVRGAGSGRG